MANLAPDEDFIVWGIDRTPYGPVDVSTLASWVRDERVTAETWIFRSSERIWQKASQMPELKGLLDQKAGMTLAGVRADGRKIKTAEAGQLRGIKILAGLSDEQLGRFARYGVVQEVGAGTVIVKQDERDEILYLIVKGEMRVRIVVAGEETVLALLGAGECFGDLALLDQGPRSADVVANSDSLVVKISGTAFDELSKTEGDALTPILHALDRTLAERIRSDNQRYGNAVSGARSKQ